MERGSLALTPRAVLSIRLMSLFSESEVLRCAEILCRHQGGQPRRGDGGGGAPACAAWAANVRACRLHADLRDVMLPVCGEELARAARVRMGGVRGDKDGREG